VKQYAVIIDLLEYRDFQRRHEDVAALETCLRGLTPRRPNLLQRASDGLLFSYAMETDAGAESLVTAISACPAYREADQILVLEIGADVAGSGRWAMLIRDLLDGRK